MIAQTDGYVAPEETTALREVALDLGLSIDELEAMLNLEKDDIRSAYKVLGITADATNDEVKAAYRKNGVETSSRPCGNIGRRHPQSCRKEIPRD